MIFCHLPAPCLSSPLRMAASSLDANGCPFRTPPPCCLYCLARPARLALHARLVRRRLKEVALGTQLYDKLAARSPQPAATHAQPIVVSILPPLVVHEQLARVAVAALAHHRRVVPGTVRVLRFQPVAQPGHGSVWRRVAPAACRRRGRAQPLDRPNHTTQYLGLVRVRPGLLLVDSHRGHLARRQVCINVCSGVCSDVCSGVCRRCGLCSRLGSASRLGSCRAASLLEANLLCARLRLDEAL